MSQGIFQSPDWQICHTRKSMAGELSGDTIYTLMVRKESCSSHFLCSISTKWICRIFLIPGCIALLELLWDYMWVFSSVQFPSRKFSSHCREVKWLLFSDRWHQGYLYWLNISVHSTFSISF